MLYFPCGRVPCGCRNPTHTRLTSMAVRREREPTYGAAATGVAVGSDHAGFALKNQIIAYIKEAYPALQVRDCGTFNEERVDYPDVARNVCDVVLSGGQINRGILLDGAGVASGIAANKFNGIRCGVVHDHFSASMGRKHNDVNVIALGGKTLGIEAAKEIVDVFLKCAFEGDRHIPRLNKLEALERSQRGSLLDCEAPSARRSTNPAQNSPFRLVPS